MKLNDFTGLLPPWQRNLPPERCAPFMRTFITILFSSLFVNLFSQELKIDNNNKFERFNGVLSIVAKGIYKYDDKLLTVINSDTSLLKVFELGIIYPDIIIIDQYFGNHDQEIKTDTRSNQEKNNNEIIYITIDGPFDKYFSNDSLIISDFKEVKNMKNFKIRKFTFLLFHPNRANPTEYYIELINNKATKNLNIETFIQGAKLNKITKGSLLI